MGSGAVPLDDAVNPWAGPGDLGRGLRQVAAGLFGAGAALFAWFAFFAGTVPVPLIGVAGALAAGAVALWWGPGARA
jgi:hypothetical protein